MTSTMRIRLLWALLTIVVLLGGLAAASPYLINSRVVKTQISKQISDWMGLPVTVRGEPVVTVFPYLTVKLKDVEVTSNLGDGEPPLVAMDTLKSEMYWLPLLLGKFEVRRFNLENPVFELVRDEEGGISWDMTKGSLVANDDDGETEGLKLSDIKLGTFRIAGGKAHYVNRATGRDETLSDINLSFNWPNTGRAAAIEGRFSWRDEAIELDARSAMPMELFDGGLSPLSLHVQSPSFEMQVDGTAATLANLQLEGDFSFRTSNLRSVFGKLGIALPSAEGFEAASLEARAHLIGASVSFSDMSMMLDNNRADGVLQVDFRRDRALIQGTLASDALNLTPYLVPRDGAVSLIEQDMTSRDLGWADLDIRLSANSMTLGAVSLGRTAATLMTRNNQLSFSIGETYAYGGRVEASLELRPSRENADDMTGHLRAKANGVLAGSVSRELAGEEYISGTSVAEVDLQGDGDTLRQIMTKLHGDVSLVITDGSFSRFSLDGLQSALEAGEEAGEDELPLGADLYQGETGFDVFSIRGRMEEDVIEIDGLRLTSGQRSLSGTADLSLFERRIDFPGLLAIYDSTDPAAHSTDTPVRQLTFHISGPWASPVAMPHRDSDAPLLPDQDILAPGVPTNMTPSTEPAQPSVDKPSVDQPAAEETPAERNVPAPMDRPDTSDPLQPVDPDDTGDLGIGSDQAGGTEPAGQEPESQNGLETFGEEAEGFLERTFTLETIKRPFSSVTDLFSSKEKAE